MKHRTFDQARPLSWSAISSFEYDAEQWYRKYVLNEEIKPSAEMLFGSMVDKKVQAEPKFLPGIHRYSSQQYKLECTFNKIPLIGFPDQWAHITKDGLSDTKTGVKAWDQKRADETGQLTMYLLMLFLMEQVKPENVTLHIDWIPTRRTEGGDFKVDIDFIRPIKVHSFETKRSMVQILDFAARIKSTHKAMLEYCKHHE